MSDNIIEITENTNYSITIDTSLIQNNNNVVIKLTNPNKIDVINNTTVLVSDLPQGYPLDWTTGTLPISRVSGLDIVGISGISVSSNSGTYTVAVTGTFGLTSEEVDDRISQLLIGGNGISLNYNDNFNTLTISTTGLQPSGNYSVIGHNHIISDVSGLQLSLDSKQPSGVYASGIHTHITSDINDFSSGVSGLLPSISGSEYIVSNFNNNVYTISITGVQPSGNYANVVHNHASSDITNFNSSVSGLLPVKNISAGSGILVSNNSGDFSVSVTGQFGLTSEQVDDRVSNLLQAGSYINLNYDDSADSLTISATGLQPSGNYSVIGHNHIISDVSGLQLSLDSKQPSGVYASGIHYHVSNDITNFDSSVDARITLANLQPSGNYSVVGHSHDINDINGLQNALDNKQPSGIYASGIHNHNVSDITNFSSAVSGLLPTISGSGYVTSNFSNNSYIISVSGLQPSGNYSTVGHSHSSNDISNFSSSVNGLVSGVYAPLLSPNFSGVPTAPTASNGTNNTQIANTQFVRNEISNLVNSAPSTLDTLNELAAALGNDPNFATTVVSGLAQKSNIGHTHTTSDITNFSSGVSGLLPVSNVLGGTNISVSSSGSVYTVSVSGQLGLTGEQVDDRVNDLLKGGQYINLNYDDAANSLTINATGLQPSGNYSLIGHNHPYTDISNFASGVSDSLTTTLLAGSFIELIYSSGLDTLIIGTSGLQPSGNYSVVGHTHTSSDITNFNSSVSGLLPTIANSGDNRILTSTGSTVGINAESNLTFNGSLLSISGSGVFSSGLSLTNQTANTIAGFDGSRNIVSLATGTYPSLTELSYVKGVTSSVQTQLDNKAASSHTHTSSNITDFNSSVSGLLPVKNIIEGNYVGISNSSGIFTISATGLQPSGNYSLDNHSHGNISSSGTIGSASEQVVVTTTSGTLTTSPTISTAQIANNSVTGAKLANTVMMSGIGSSLSASFLNATVYLGGGAQLQGPVTIGSAGSLLSISNSGIISSGIWQGTPIGINYGGTGATNAIAARNNLEAASITHNHGNISSSGNIGDTSDLLVITGLSGILTTSSGITSSYITNFDSSVSGLLPIKDIVSGTGILVTSSSGIYTINSIISGVAESASLVTNVFNKTSNTINKGSVVYINGGQGDQPTIQLAIAANEIGSSKTYGIVQNNIPSMSLGKVVVAGALTAFDTDQYNPTAPHGDVNGTTLWLSPTISGAMTTTKPSAPYHMVSVGTVVRTHQNEGVIEVRIQNGFELEELHNVAISGVSNGQFLQYNSGSNLWVPSNSGNFSSLSAVSGIVEYLKVYNEKLLPVAEYSAARSGVGIGPSSVSGLISVIDIQSFTLLERDGIAGIRIFDDNNPANVVFGIISDVDDSTNYINSLGGYPLSINSDYGVGINTPSPNYDLDVAGTGNFEALLVNGTGVSLSGHNHTVSQITDFNSSVSGLLPVTNILGGSNITVSQSGTNFTVAVTGSLGLTTEEVDDRVSNLLVAGSGITLDYNDGSNTLTINSTGGGGSASDEIEEYAATSNFPASGNLNILYVATNTAQLYKWDGSVYYEAGPQGASTGSHATQHQADGSDPIPLTEYNVPQFTANTNNLNHLNKDVLYLSSDANNRELTGLLAPSFCCVKLLVNLNSSHTIIIDHQSTNSDPANRFLNYTGSDYYLLPGQSLAVLYSTDSMRWRIL